MSDNEQTYERILAAAKPTPLRIDTPVKPRLTVTDRRYLEVMEEWILVVTVGRRLKVCKEAAQARISKLYKYGLVEKRPARTLSNLPCFEWRALR